MKNLILNIVSKKIGMSLLLCSLMSVALMATPGEKKPFVIPELKEWKASGGYMTLGSHTRIVYDAGQPELLRIAGLMADDCFRMFQWRPEIVVYYATEDKEACGKDFRAAVGEKRVTLLK